MMDKPTLNIVLVEPRIPQNTGNVARTCACTACRLHLVGPMGFAIDDKKLKHAGLDYWHYLDITYYDGLADFFARNNGPYYYFTTKAPQRYTDVQYPDGAYLVFGREDAGLPEALLVENQEHCIRMPMRDTCRSLNLSNSVAVGVYEVLRQWYFPKPLLLSAYLRFPVQPSAFHSQPPQHLFYHTADWLLLPSHPAPPLRLHSKMRKHRL